MQKFNLKDKSELELLAMLDTLSRATEAPTRTCIACGLEIWGHRQVAQMDNPANEQLCLCSQCVADLPAGLWAVCSQCAALVPFNPAVMEGGDLEGYFTHCTTRQWRSASKDEADTAVLQVVLV